MTVDEIVSELESIPLGDTVLTRFDERQRAFNAMVQGGRITMAWLYTLEDDDKNRIVGVMTFRCGLVME